MFLTLTLPLAFNTLKIKKTCPMDNSNNSWPDNPSPPSTSTGPDPVNSNLPHATGATVPSNDPFSPNPYLQNPVPNWNNPTPVDSLTTASQPPPASSSPITPASTPPDYSASSSFTPANLPASDLSPSTQPGAASPLPPPEQPPSFISTPSLEPTPAYPPPPDPTQPLTTSSEPTITNSFTQTSTPNWLPPNPAAPPPEIGSQPTWMPTLTPQPELTNNPPAQPSPAPEPPNQSANPAPAEPIPVDSSSAPTDLSHLISNNPQTDTGQTQAAEATTPFPNSSPTPEVPTLPMEEHKGIPKWLIGLGIGLLILVAGFSAYFILGIGQSNKNNTSIPAQTTKNTVKTPAPIASPAAQATPVPTGSSNFGELEGSSSPPPATSAADLLRQRQGR